MLTYKHRLSTGHLPEVEDVISAFESLGWKFVSLEPEDDSKLPEAAVFKWDYDCAPHYPSVTSIRR